MRALLQLSKVIDWLNHHVGRLVLWLVLIAALISAGNAVVRKAFDTSSNAWLEIQWYLFSGIFLLCAGYTLLRNEHVRIDVFLHRLSPRAQNWVDLLGFLFFLLPASLLIIWLALPLVVNAYVSGEMSQNAGGLIRWPVYVLLPIGFALLALQGLSELIKRAAFLLGVIDNPMARKAGKTAEEELAEEIRALAEGAKK